VPIKIEPAATRMDPATNDEGGMGMKLMFAATAVLAMAAAAPTTGRAAEIRLICSNGYHAVIDVLGPQYEKATGNKLVVSYGLAAVLGKEIEGGAPFDITILAPPQMDALVKQGKVVADTRTVLAKSAWA
jgi:molybdate transport system substrate-binding protein